MGVAFRADRGKWGYRISRRGRLFRSCCWDQKEQAQAALDDLRSRLVRWAARADKDSIVATLGPPQHELKIADFRAASVYAVIRDGELIYVGSSQNGLRRPADSSHHMAPHFRHTDQVLAWQFNSIARARTVESELIVKYKPRFNIAGVPGKDPKRPQRPKELLTQG